MTKIDNNLPLDPEVEATMEEMIEIFLGRMPPGKWFTLSEMYAALDIKYTRGRGGTIDVLIADKLDNWNWRCHRSGHYGSLVSYIRRDYPHKPTKVKFTDGSHLTSGHSWPEYRQGRGIHGSSADEVRAKLSRAREVAKNSGGMPV